MATATKSLTTTEFVGRDGNTVSFVAVMQTIRMPSAEVRRLLGAHMTILQLVEGCETIRVHAQVTIKGSELNSKEGLQKWFSTIVDEMSQSVED